MDGTLLPSADAGGHTWGWDAIPTSSSVCPEEVAEILQDAVDEEGEADEKLTESSASLNVEAAPEDGETCRVPGATGRCSEDADPR